VAAAVAGALPDRGYTVELFVGAGGLAAGCQAAGFNTVVAADNDRDGLATLASHLHLDGGREPSHVDLSDLESCTRLVKATVETVGAEGVSLLAGGPPCQGFSTAGNNQLQSDPRNSLPESFLWFVSELRPRQVIFENVAGLVWKSRRKWFDSILNRLLRLGYHVEWRLVHCEAFGLPQRRRRVVVVAVRRGLERYAFPIGPHSIEEPSYRDFAQPLDASAPKPPTVRDAIGDLPDEPAPTADTPVQLVEDGSSSLFRAYVTGLLRLTDYVNIGSQVASGC
jgi:DNA (cytosine-5)-methyltransferase 1